MRIDTYRCDGCGESFEYGATIIRIPCIQLGTMGVDSPTYWNSNGAAEDKHFHGLQCIQTWMQREADNRK